MLYKSKEEQDLHVAQTISNLAHDEKTFNIDNRTTFADNHHAYSILLEELDESTEALEILKGNVDTLWKMVKGDFRQEEINKQLERIGLDCKLAAHEVIQVYAVALKALEQLGGKRK